MKNFNFKTLLLAIGLMVASAQPALAKRIFFNAGVWNASSPTIFAHTWGSSDSDVKMKNTKSDLYYAEIPDGNNKVIFVRDKSDASSIIWDGNEGFWNKTDTYDIPNDGKDMFTIDGWSYGSWSKSAMGFEESNNGVKIWYNPGDKTKEINHGRDGVSATDIGTVTDLYLKEYFVQLYQNAENLNGTTTLHYWVYRTSAGRAGLTATTHNGGWGDWGSFGDDKYRKPKFGNKELNDKLCDGLSSGKYTFEYYFSANGHNGEVIYCNNTSAQNFKVTFSIAPPVPTGFSASVANSGGGNGGSSTPFIVFYNQDVTLTVSAAASSDANEKLQFSFDNGTNWVDADANNQATKTIKTSKYSSNEPLSVKYRYYNTTDNLAGTEGSTTINYRSAQYTITLNNNGGVDGDKTSTFVKYGQTSFDTYSSTKVSKVGYELNGWWTNDATPIKIAGTQKQATLEESVEGYTNSDRRWIKTSNVILYAGWTANTYRVYLDKGGSSSGVSQVTATYDADMPPATAPSLTGYDFAGYFDGQNGTGTKYYNNDMSSAHIWDKAEADVTLYAYYTPKSYTVTLEQTSATTQGATSATVYYNTVPTQVTSLPTRTGYTFGGYNTNTSLLLVNAQGEWQASVDGFTDADGKWIKTTGASLSPIWNPITTTVTLKANGGTGDDQTFDVVFDSDINTAGKTAHTRTGYDLKGYFTAATGGSKILNADLTVRSAGSAIEGWLNASNKWKNPNTTADLFAQWTAHQWTITLDDNEGTGGSGTKTATYGATTGITSVTIPTRDNYSFAGYYSDQAGEGVQVYDVNGNLVANATGYTDADKNWIKDEAVTLYAKWNSVGNYVVTLNNQSATTAGTASVNVQINTTTGLTTNITCPEKTGYTFGGYFTATGGKGTQLINADGSWIKPATDYIDSDGNWIFNGNVTLNAYWIPNQTVVTFDNQGATTAGTGQRTLTYNSTDFGNAFESPAKTGYTFGGYFTETNGGGTQLISAEGAWIADVAGYTETSGDKIKWIKTTTDPLTLYAKWTPITYTITYAGNGNTGGSTANSTHTYDVAKELTTNGFTRAYIVTYEYDGATGGNETANAVANYIFANWTYNETNYNDGQSVTNLTSTNGATVTMTAQWTSASVTLPTPVKTGYTFEGWYNESSKVGEAGASYTPTANITLTANWTEIMSSLSTAVNDWGTTAGQANPTVANSVSAIGVTTTATITAEAAKAGYTFEGWTLTNCARTNGGAEKATTITVKGLGNAEAAAVTANYAEDLSTNWKLNMNMAPSDGTWTLTPFEKRTGESTGKVAYASVELQMDKKYTFSIQRKNSPTGETYFKNANDMHSYNCTNWTFVTDGEDHGIQATISGTYTFKIDFTNADAPVISAIYPDVNCVIGEFNLWRKADNPLDPTTLSTTIALGENVTQAFRIVYKGGYYRVNNTMTSESCTDWILYSSQEHPTDVQIKTTVAGDYTFTVKPVDGQPNQIKLSISYPGENYRTVKVDNGETETQVDVKEVTETPLVAKQYLNGMRFYRWVVTNADNVDKSSSITINHPESYSTHMHGAKEDGLIVKATYTTQDIVYLNKQYIKNNWPGDVYVYFYKGAYWDEGNKGSGSKIGDKSNCISDGKQMTRVSDKSDIYYYDYSKDNLSGRDSHIAFLDKPENDYDNFVACQAIYRGDFQECSPMFVPRDWKSYYNEGAAAGRAVYYQEGYWRTYGSTEAGLSLVFWKGKAKTIVPFTSDSKNDNTFTAKITISDVSNDTYFKLRCCGGDEGNQDYWYGCNSNMSATSCSNYKFYSGNRNENANCGIGLTSTGDYVFTLSLADGQVYVSVEYPLSNGDYRLVSVTDGKVHDNGMFYKSSTDRVDTVSFFITNAHTSLVKLQECTNATSVPAVWADVAGKSINTSEYATGIYNFTFTQSGESSKEIAKLGEYKGNFYIRTAIAAGAWDAYKGSADNLLPYIEYGLDESQKFKFTHAYTNWVEKDKNVKFCIANDYSLCISDTLVGDNILGEEDNADWLKNGANIRFMWNKNTNALSRAYISGSTNDEEKYLMLIGDANMFDTQGQALANNELKFTDKNNWVYQADIKAKPGCAVKLTAQYTIGSDKHVQYFMGSELTTRTIISGSATDKQYTMRVVYDFKTNRLTAGWVPDGTTISDKIELGGDMLISRTHQGNAQQITFGTGGEVSDIHHIYGVLTLQKDEMAGTKANSYSDKATNANYEKTMYWISFPFDVNISEIFGVDGYGKKWIMQKYRGDLRAQKGWFAETSTFWEYMDISEKLNAYEGYLFIVDANYFNTLDADVWKSSATEANFYFPSAEKNIGIINKASVTITVPEHECKINRTFGDNNSMNHMITDSHWNVIGVPTFQNSTASTISEKDTNFKSYYAWVPTTNSYSAQAALGTNITFNTMQAYMVQYAGTITWENVSVVAKKAPYAYVDDKNYMIELFFNGNGAEDHTYINLADGAHIDFVLNEDMMKIDNAGQPNIYSFAGAYNVAYNETTFDNQMVVLGVNAPKDGSYTFAMPKDFSGSAILVDLEEGTTTDLNVSNYSVDLNKGTYNNRFQLMLEVEAKTPTAVDNANGEWNADGKTKKLFINDNIYLINGGRIFNASGTKLR